MFFKKQTNKQKTNNKQTNKQKTNNKQTNKQTKQNKQKTLIKKHQYKCIWVLLGGIHEVIVKKLVNCTWQHLKLEAPVGTKARDCQVEKVQIDFL